MKIKRNLVMLPALLFLLTIFLVGCQDSKDALAVAKGEIILVEDSDSINEILSEKDSVLYFGRPTCPDCEAFSPILNKFLENNDMSVYYYNTDERRNDENYSDIMEVFDIKEVPSLLSIKGSKIISKYSFDTELENEEIALSKLEKFYSLYKETPKESPREFIESDFVSEYSTEIMDYTQFKEILKESGTKFIYASRPDCPYCSIFEPLVEEALVSAQKNIYYLNTTRADSELLSLLDELNVIGVPIILKFDGDKIVDRLTFAKKTSEIENFMN